MNLVLGLTATEIRPLPGTWVSSANVVNASIQCRIASGHNTLKVSFSDVQSPYNLAQIIALNGQRVLLDELNPQHQGNIYRVDYDGTVQTYIEVKVLSPTQIQPDSVITTKALAGYVTTISGTFEHVSS